MFLLNNKKSAYILFLILFIFLISSCREKKESSYYLTYRILENDKRYRTFIHALDLMKEREMKVIVETGTARGGIDNCAGDGCSTIIFSEWAKDNDADFYSVDIDADAVEKAKNAIKLFYGRANFTVSDSVQFLKDFKQYNKKIDFLYLDSMDVDVNNPLPSQEHHLKEIEAAYPYLHEKSAVMIDDCIEPDQGCKSGKGKLVLLFLLDKGWKKSINEYQVIMTR